MEITYTSRYSPNRERKMGLGDIVIDSSRDYDQGQLEAIRARANKAIEFNSVLIEILYKKGILNKEDIKTIVEHFDSVDEDKKFEVKINE